MANKKVEKLRGGHGLRAGAAGMAGCQSPAGDRGRCPGKQGKRKGTRGQVRQAVQSTFGTHQLPAATADVGPYS